MASMNFRKCRRKMLFIGRSLRMCFAFRCITLCFLSIGITANSYSCSQNLDCLAERISKEGKRNFVLNQLEYGSAAMKLARMDLAEVAFDQALEGIESVYGTTLEAAKARSIWYEEGQKIYKGEPYERAMAYYYRGLLYLFSGDYDNAHASFSSGLLQDAFAEEEQYRSDFTLLMLMKVWAARLAGMSHMVREGMSEFQAYRPHIKIPDPTTHTLVLIETGKSPRKLLDGVGGQELVYRRGKKFNDYYAEIVTADDVYKTDPIEDLYYQASTRGGRQVDRILDGKILYKEQWTDIGSVVMELSTQVALLSTFDKQMDMLSPEYNALNINVDTGPLAIGASAVMFIAEKIKPKADNRYWHNLPETIHVGFFEKPEKDGIAIKILDRERSEIFRVNVNTPHLFSDSNIVWYKTH